MIINNISELVNYGTLKAGDTINIAGVTYEVYNCFLCALYSDYNSKVFGELHISDKNTFAKYIYGYDPRFGTSDISFPEYRSEDFEAAYKIALALYIYSFAITRPSNSITKYKINNLSYLSEIVNYICRNPKSLGTVLTNIASDLPYNTSLTAIIEPSADTNSTSTEKIVLGLPKRKSFNIVLWKSNLSTI